MRVWLVVVGALLLVVALLGILTAGILTDVADACRAARCSASDAAVATSIGRTVFAAGALLGLGGFALIVVGAMTQPPVRIVVADASALRACPACDAPGPAEARYCHACGAAVAPVKRAT